MIGARQASYWMFLLAMIGFWIESRSIANQICYALIKDNCGSSLNRALQQGHDDLALKQHKDDEGGN